MMQYIIVSIIVALCALYLLRKFLFKSPNNNSACGSCDRCGGKKGGCH